MLKLNQFFTFSSTIERLRQGPLSEYLDAYAASVAKQGYARHSIRRQIVAIADFSWWLRLKHIELRNLDSRIVDRFLQSRRRQQRLGRGDPKTWQRLLTLLCEKGAVKKSPFRRQFQGHTAVVGEGQRISARLFSDSMTTAVASACRENGVATQKDRRLWPTPARRCARARARPPPASARGAAGSPHRCAANRVSSASLSICRGPEHAATSRIGRRPAGLPRGTASPACRR